MPVLNPILREMIAVGVVSPTRWYLYFDGNAYGEISPITLSGEFYLDWWGTYGGSNDVFMTIGSDKTAFIVSPTGKLCMYVNGSWIVNNMDVGLLPFSLYDVVHCRVWRGDNDVIYFSVKNVTTGQSATGQSGAYANDISISRIGAGRNSSYDWKHLGYMWDVDIDGRRFYKLNKNEYPSLMFTDSLNKDGAEMVVNGDFSNSGDGWVVQSDWSVIDGKAVCSTDGTSSGARSLVQSIGMKAEKTYILELDVVRNSGVLLLWNGTENITIATSSGHVKKIINYTDDYLNLVLYGSSGYGGFDGSVDNVSIKETTVIQGFNFQESSFFRSLPSA